MPVIIAVRPQLRAEADRSQRFCWHVSYQFCNLPAEITVRAENADEARAKAVEQLRLRGLKVA
jgi:hypothetical protein